MSIQFQSVYRIGNIGRSSSSNSHSRILVEINSTGEGTHKLIDDIWHFHERSGAGNYPSILRRNLCALSPYLLRPLPELAFGSRSGLETYISCGN